MRLVAQYCSHLDAYKTCNSATKNSSIFLSCSLNYLDGLPNGLPNGIFNGLLSILTHGFTNEWSNGLPNVFPIIFPIEVPVGFKSH